MSRLAGPAVRPFVMPCARSGQTVDLRINARAGEKGQTFAVSMNGVPLAEMPLPPPAANVENSPCRDLPPLRLALCEGLNTLLIQTTGREALVNCLKFSAVGGAAPLPATLPWSQSWLDRKIDMSENTIWKFQYLFADGVTTANQWQGELSSEDGSLIPNDAQHLALA